MSKTRAAGSLSSNDFWTPDALKRRLGGGTVLAREGVRSVYGALLQESPKEFVEWRSHFELWGGRSMARDARPVEKLAGRYGVELVGDGAERFLFAMQTYYAMLVESVPRFFGWGGGELLRGNFFSWHRGCSLHGLNERLDEALSAFRLPLAKDDGECDWFKAVYQDLFPRAVRHALGEYYTPDWLARHVLDQVVYAGQPECRLLDPSCGSGTFLVMALRRLWKGGGEKSRRNGFLEAHLPIVGLDLNPLAVMTARANYWMAMADGWPQKQAFEIPVYLCDSILGEPSVPGVLGAFDYVVGNPPWIAWDNLPEEYREATKPLWERYGLFSLSGNEARHGGGKKDLSSLMLYAAADRYLKQGGRLGMVVTQTVFQSKGAGDGFRRFRIGDEGPPLKVLRVDDLADLRPFDAANWTSTVVLEKGRATEYPVEYVVWGEKRGTGDEGRGAGVRRLAYPVDPARENSPWRICCDTEDYSPSAFRLFPSVYSAHLGANTGGANGVYWLDVLEATAGGVRIRNVAKRGKREVEAVECAIEADLVFPLLRWADVKRWSAVSRGHILLSQDPAVRVGIAEEKMRREFPRTLEYLERFRALLSDRAAYRRYQGRHPFYSMYNVGTYTVAPVKVVWRRMDRRINAAVVEAVDDSLLGLRSVVPQETCVLVACESSDEAHYLCAMLNSKAVGELISACSVRGGKGFGTPGVLEYVPLRRFAADDCRHRELVDCSRMAHAGDVEDAERAIDRLATVCLGL